MNKQYKLKTQILREIDGCITLGYYSYGHHDKSLFAEAVKGDWEPDESTEEVINKTVHKWVKLTPWCGTNQMMFVYSNEYRKGFIPITEFKF